MWLRQPHVILRGHLLPVAGRVDHPRFFAYFTITASPPGVLGEFLSAALNLYIFARKTFLFKSLAF